MKKEDKQSVISICRILADKMDNSGKVAVEQVISAVRDLEEQLPEQEPVFYPQAEGITPTVVRQEPRENAISRQAVKLTEEQAIAFLQESGWMEKHEDAVVKKAIKSRHLMTPEEAEDEFNFEQGKLEGRLEALASIKDLCNSLESEEPVEMLWYGIPPTIIESDEESEEHGDVLDKIRAEIEQNAYPIVYGVNNHEKGMTLYGILQVIDKCRTESEVQK